jgi:tRNA pseudouridine55 synthase
MKDRSVDTGGLVLLDKPAGITSHAVVDRARRVLGTRRVGHAGTLDPFATGLLILLVRRATRLLPYLDAEPKVYRAIVRFGTRTSTDDIEGTPVAEAAPPEQAVVERAIPTLTGHLLQRPPAFSAKRVAGVRAYAAARRGEPLALEPVAVTVHKWIVLGRSGADLDVEVHCSAGTYVRALARDLGEACGSAAHLAALRRTGSGRFTVDEARSVDDMERGDFTLLPPGAAVRHLPAQQLDDLDARRICRGQNVTALPDLRGDVAALCHGDDLIAVGVRDGESWRPKVVLWDA